MSRSDLPLTNESIDPSNSNLFPPVSHQTITQSELQQLSTIAPLQAYQPDLQPIHYPDQQQQKLQSQYHDLYNSYTQHYATETQPNHNHQNQQHQSNNQQSQQISYQHQQQPHDLQNQYQQTLQPHHLQQQLLSNHHNQQQSQHLDQQLQQPLALPYQNNNSNIGSSHYNSDSYDGIGTNHSQIPIMGNDSNTTESLKYNSFQNTAKQQPPSESKSIKIFKSETPMVSNRINKPRNQQQQFKFRTLDSNTMSQINTAYNPTEMSQLISTYSQHNKTHSLSSFHIDDSRQDSESYYQHPYQIQENNELLTVPPTAITDYSLYSNYQSTQQQYQQHSHIPPYQSNQRQQPASLSYNHYTQQNYVQPTTYYYPPNQSISQTQQQLGYDSNVASNYDYVLQKPYYVDPLAISQNSNNEPIPAYYHQSLNSEPEKLDSFNNNHLFNRSASLNVTVSKKLPYAQDSNTIQRKEAIATDHLSNSEVYFEEKYYSKPFDLKIISDNNDPFANKSHLVVADPLSKFFNSGSYLESEEIKYDNDPQTLDFNMPIIISKLNSTQLQKFILTRKQEFEILFNNKFNAFKLGSFQQAKTEILREWKSTKSSIEISYCDCKKYIWFSRKKTECPICKPMNLAKLSSLDNKTTFAVELLNNFVLSILLNKKLRVFLKKNIRPPKNINEPSKYLNMSHDGNLYREAVRPIASQIDFAMTFSMVVITNTCADTINFGGIYFVLNELPENLKYNPKFLFCAAVFNLDNSHSWNTELLRPLFAYLEYLQTNTIKVSLNRHEYHVKMFATAAIGDDSHGRNNCIDIFTASNTYPCRFCAAPRQTLQNSSGNKIQSIHSTGNFVSINDDIQNDLKNRGILIQKKESDHWALRNSCILDNITYFQDNKNLIFDTKHLFVHGLFKEGFIKMINKYYKHIISDADDVAFQNNVTELDKRAASHNIFSDPLFCSNMFDNSNSSVPSDYSTDDMQKLQFMFTQLFFNFLKNRSEGTQLSKKPIPIRYKYMSLMLELNTYILALWCSDVERNKIERLKEGLNDLLAELERLSRYDEFIYLNMLLMLPLHYLKHAYEKWEDFGNMKTVSIDRMITSINDLNDEIGSDELYKSQVPEKLKLFNINNCVQIYNYPVPDYPNCKFLNLQQTEFSQMSLKSQGKFNEFNRRYLFEAVTNADLQNVCVIEKIDSFVTNDVTIYPEPRVTNNNLARIKGIKRNIGWRFVHIYSMFKVSYTYPVTNETVSAVFIEYKETKTRKLYFKSSSNRPAISLGEFLTQSTCRELRCVWLEDIQLVGLVSFEGNQYVYDPLMTLDRAFKMS